MDEPASDDDSGPSLFELASHVFDSTTDTDTGLRILRVTPHAIDEDDEDRGKPWYTVYHQTPCFLDGGRRVMLRRVARGGGSYALDLATGEATRILPKGYYVMEVCDKTSMVLTAKRRKNGLHILLWDMVEQEEIASFERDDWTLWAGKIMTDGKKVVVGTYRGQYYDAHCHSQFHLFGPDCEETQLLDADGYFCNHIMPCPTDPDMFSYNKWPSPKVPTESVIRVRTIDGSFEKELPQIEGTVRPGNLWGGQRDHYLWSEDGKRILSYFSPGQFDVPPESHFDFGWWVSAMDWRTGEDFSVKYPDERWGCNFHATPDSRYIVSAGGRTFHKIYAIDIEGLRDGWNEHILCSYQPSEEDGQNHGPFHMPRVLPDQSGVLFTAGWPGPDWGVCLVEWPKDL